MIHAGTNCVQYRLPKLSGSLPATLPPADVDDALQQKRTVERANAASDRRITHTFSLLFVFFFLSFPPDSRFISACAIANFLFLISITLHHAPDFHLGRDKLSRPLSTKERAVRLVGLARPLRCWPVAAFSPLNVNVICESHAKKGLRQVCALSRRGEADATTGVPGVERVA